MNEDSTQNLSSSHDETLRQILAAVNDLQVSGKDLQASVKELQGRVESLESKVEERLYDTRPIWEKAVADIAQLQKGQESLHDEMRKGFRDLKRQFSILNDTFLEVRADYKDLDRRVYQIEEPQG